MEKLKRLLGAISHKQINLKWVKHALWIVALGGLFVYLNVAPPFLSIASNSMEPVLSRGDLIFSNNVAPDQIQVGDIIVFKVSTVFQEKYGYPPTICHRVVRIESSVDKFLFRTKGDYNTSDDPFMTPGSNLVGRERLSVPVVGYLVMFSQSSQGKFFLVGLILLFLFYSNSVWLETNAKKLRSSLVGVSNTEFIDSQKQLDTKLDGMSGHVTQAMNSFASAMSEYAQHIASHTSAIKSLARVAEHLEAVISNPPYHPPSTAHQALSYQQQEAPAREPVKPIEVTPELKSAVKRFIIDYSRDHNINTEEVTPELRSAVWAFIQRYVNEPLPRYSPEQTVEEPEAAGESADTETSDSESSTLAG